MISLPQQIQSSTLKTLVRTLIEQSVLLVYLRGEDVHPTVCPLPEDVFLPDILISFELVFPCWDK